MEQRELNNSGVKPFGHNFLPAAGGIVQQCFDRRTGNCGLILAIKFAAPGIVLENFGFKLAFMLIQSYRQPATGSGTLEQHASFRVFQLGDGFDFPAAFIASCTNG